MNSIDFNARWGALRSYAAKLPAVLTRDQWYDTVGYVLKEFVPEIVQLERELIRWGYGPPPQSVWDMLEELHAESERANQYLYDIVRRKSVKTDYVMFFSQEPEGRLHLNDKPRREVQEIVRCLCKKPQHFRFGRCIQWNDKFLTITPGTFEGGLRHLRKMGDLLTDLREVNYTEFVLDLQKKPLIIFD